MVADRDGDPLPAQQTTRPLPPDRRRSVPAPASSDMSPTRQYGAQERLRGQLGLELLGCHRRFINLGHGSLLGDRHTDAYPNQSRASRWPATSVSQRPALTVTARPAGRHQTAPGGQPVLQTGEGDQRWLMIGDRGRTSPTMGTERPIGEQRGAEEPVPVRVPSAPLPGVSLHVRDPQRRIGLVLAHCARDGRDSRGWGSTQCEHTHTDRLRGRDCPPQNPTAAARSSPCAVMRRARIGEIHRPVVR